MGLLQEIFGSRPKVPTLEPIDYGDVQKAAIQQNINATPLATQWASGINAANQAELDQLLTAQVPDLANIKKNVSSNLADWSKGMLSESDQASVERSAFAKSLGHAGGSMAGDWVARDIGLTSYQVANQAMSSAERWLNFTRTNLMPNLVGAESMMVTPQQRLAQVTDERNMSFARNWLNQQVRAMPDPATHGVWQAIDSYIHSYGGQNSYAPTQYPGMGGGGGNPGGYTSPSYNAWGNSPPSQWGLGGYDAGNYGGAGFDTAGMAGALGI